MKELRPLICVLSPRDVTEVLAGHETFKDIPHLWLKYWSAIQAYHIVTDFFLNKKKDEYTHLVIAPDDLIVIREHYNSLVSTLEKEDYPVLSGICNVDYSHPDTFNICIDEVPNIIRKLRRHRWVDRKNLPEGIIQVKFAGMPFIFIRRDIVERVPLRGDTPYDPTRKHIEPMSFDAAFSWECHLQNIPIRVDTRVKMAHLRNMKYVDRSGAQAQDIKTRRLKPKAYLQIGDKIEDYTDEYLAYIYKLNPYNSNVYLKRWIKSSMLSV